MNLVPYLPENIRVVDEAKDGLAVVTVEIEAHEKRDVTLPVSRIEITGVPRGYSVDFEDLEEITIPVTGLTTALEELNTEDIVVILDVAPASRAGSYTRTLQIDVPGECGLGGDVKVSFELLKGTSGRGNTERPDTGRQEENN